MSAPAGSRPPPLPSLARSAAANQSHGMEFHESGRLYAVCGADWSFSAAGAKAARVHTVPWLNVTLACFVFFPSRLLYQLPLKREMNTN